MPIQSTFGAASKRGYSGSGKASVPFYFSATASSTGRFPGTPTIVDTFSNSSFTNNSPASGYVRIILPATQKYSFIVRGSSQYNNTKSGIGAEVLATATLTTGTQLIIACGQIGVTADSNHTGGSRGTFIRIRSNLAGSTPFLVAGGAGGYGLGNTPAKPSYANASLNQNGKVGWNAGFNNNYGEGAGFPQAPWGFGNGATSKASFSHFLQISNLGFIVLVLFV